MKITPYPRTYDYCMLLRPEPGPSEKPDTVPLEKADPIRKFTSLYELKTHF